MAHKVIDRCKETTSTTGTGNLTLAGAVTGYVSMASALTADGDTSWFCAENGAEWEIFLGTRVSATELARTTLIKSSTGSTINFSSAPTVFSTVPGLNLAPLGGPVFRATRATTDQTVTNGVATKVQLNSEDFDIGGCFDSTTNYRFTPNVAGIYRFEWAVRGAGAATFVAVLSVIQKNGVDKDNGSYSAIPSYTAGLSTGSSLIQMNGTTDYIELLGYVNAGGTCKVGIGSFLSGSLVSPAP